MGFLARYHVFMILFGIVAAGVLAYSLLSGNGASDGGGSETRATVPQTVVPHGQEPVPSISGVGGAADTQAGSPGAPAPETGETGNGSSGSLSGMVVCIDAGHASNPDLGQEPTGPGSAQTKVKDPGGTSGAVSGTPEHEITLAISLELKRQLEARGATVIMTRETVTFDGGNRERALIANSAGAGLFIRLHCDGSSNPSYRGVSTLYPAAIPGWTDDIQQPSHAAAEAVQSALVAATGAPDLGTRARSDITGFNWADVPAILVETGFMTNAGEDALLNMPEYQSRIAQGISAGIAAFLSAA